MSHQFVRKRTDEKLHKGTRVPGMFIHQHAHRLQPQQLKCQDIIQLFGCSAVL